MSAPENQGDGSTIAQSQPANPAPAPAPAAAAPPAPPPDPAPQGNDDPKWLAGRLEKTRLNTLKELGLDGLGVEDAKAAIKAAREKLESEKSEVQRLTEKVSALSGLQSQLETYQGTVKQLAEREMGSLTEAQKAAVSAIAGDDHNKILTAITQLRPTWAAAAPAASPPAPAPHGDTAPPRDAPSETTAGPVDHKATYERLRAEHPFAAERYREQYAAQIFSS